MLQSLIVGICFYIFLKYKYLDYVPKSIKKKLNIKKNGFFYCFIIKNFKKLNIIKIS